MEILIKGVEKKKVRSMYYYLARRGKVSKKGDIIVFTPGNGVNKEDIKKKIKAIDQRIFVADIELEKPKIPEPEKRTIPEFQKQSEISCYDYNENEKKVVIRGVRILMNALDNKPVDKVELVDTIGEVFGCILNRLKNGVSII